MEFKLSAQTREKNERLEKDFIPAVLYGKEVKSQALKVKTTEVMKIFSQAGESNLIMLDKGDSLVKVLIKDVQRDPLKNSLSHVDFYQVNMKEKLNTEIPLHFIGESKAVKEMGGMLMKYIDALEVECLPSDLTDHLEVDISILDSFEKEIRMHDIKFPKGIVLLHEDHNEIVVSVQEPKGVADKPSVEESPVVSAETVEPEKK